MTKRHQSWLTWPTIAAAGAFLLAGCLLGAGEEPADGDELALGSYALTADDEATDGFDEGADEGVFLDALPEAYDEDEAPAPEEVDADELAPTDPSAWTIRHVLVTWGHPLFREDFGEVVQWKGRIESATALVGVVRKVRFEGEDALIPDGDPHAVTFSTVTGPHYDGLLLRVAIPADDGGGTIAFVTGHHEASLALADLVAGHHAATVVDALGNVLRVDTVPSHVCGHGFLTLHWKRAGLKGGIFGGRWVSADGSSEGYLMGLWGRVGGKNRLKGMILDADHAFLGTLRGAYRPFFGPAAPNPAMGGGAFRAHWRVADGAARGVLGGIYLVGDEPGVGTAQGVYLRRCAEAPDACPADLSLTEPAGACDCTTTDDGGAGDDCTCETPPEAICPE